MHPFKCSSEEKFAMYYVLITNLEIASRKLRTSKISMRNQNWLVVIFFVAVWNFASCWGLAQSVVIENQPTATDQLSSDEANVLTIDLEPTSE
jgi:hypothetical protein